MNQKKDNRKREEPQQYASAVELSGWLGISERRISQLAQEGHVVRSSHGKYILRDSVAQYIQYIRDSSQGSNLKERELQLKCEKLEQDISQRRDSIAEEERLRITADIVDGLQEIRAAYLRMKLNKKDTDKLKKAFDRAVEKVREAGTDEETPE